jgi:hypothetical protein
MLVATCNRNSSGGSDQKNCGLKPAQANSSQKNKNLHKKGLV